MNRALLEMLADMEPELHTEVHRAGSDEPMRRPDHRAKARSPNALDTIRSARSR